MKCFEQIPAYKKSFIEEIKFLYKLVNEDYNFTSKLDRSDYDHGSTMWVVGRLNVLGEMKGRLEGILERHNE
tara:strand:- start:9075 stop:9290 length:216 start_codon:yes stop_codon:yes gene_type:complete